MLSYNNEHFIILEFHHAISDGISVAELNHQLLKAYTDSTYHIEAQPIIEPPEHY